MHYTIHVNADIVVMCGEVYQRLRCEWKMILLLLLGLVCASTIDASCFSPFSLPIFQNKILTSSFSSNFLEAFLSLLNPLLSP